MLKLHLVDLLSIRYTTNFATSIFVTNRTDKAYALVYGALASSRPSKVRQTVVSRRSY